MPDFERVLYVSCEPKVLKSPTTSKLEGTVVCRQLACLPVRLIHLQGQMQAPALWATPASTGDDYCSSEMAGDDSAPFAAEPPQWVAVLVSPRVAHVVGSWNWQVPSAQIKIFLADDKNNKREVSATFGPKSRLKLRSGRG